MKYLLIGLVTIVWGLIVFRIVQGIGNDASVAAPIPQMEAAAPVNIRDTFSLLADYPDPFLDQQDSVAEDPAERSGFRKDQPGISGNNPAYAAPPVPAFNVSDFKYTGFIGNAKRRTAIVTYKGTEYMLKETDKVEMIQILKITPNFMLVSFEGEHHTVNMER